MPNHTFEVILYTRQDCHLCGEALGLLERYGLTPEVIDVDRDVELARRYACCVPVVVVDGRVRFRGQVNEVLLRRMLRARSH